MRLTNKQIFPKSQSGFSLMELMIVIAIIGLLSAISIPRLFNPEHKASKAARELMGDMQWTRISAIKSNQNWAIVFVPGNNNYLICSDSGGDDWASTGNNTIEKTISFATSAAGVQYGAGIATAPMDATPFGDGVTYNIGGDPNVLTFDPGGICPLGYVYLFYGEASYAVGTLTTGIVRIRRWSGGAWL